MALRVKEIFHTLQGEGVHAGRAAVFCRFSGCNLWTGREQDRSDAACRFCDTDFTGTDGPGGGVFESEGELAEAIVAAFPYPLAPLDSQDPLDPLDGDRWRPYVVFTGGEPALQLTSGLLDALHARGCQCGVETNGTLPLPAGLDWVAVSPKAGTRLAVTQGDELKLVWPQHGVDPADFAGLDFGHFILQPRDDAACGAGGNASGADHVAACVRYCLEHPRWRLGLQTHKFLGIR